MWWLFPRVATTSARIPDTVSLLYSSHSQSRSSPNPSWNVSATPTAMFTRIIQGRREEKGFPCKREGSVLWLTRHPNSPHTELKEWFQMRRENQLLYQSDQLGASWSSRAPPAGFSVSRHRHQGVPRQIQRMSSNF